MDVLKVISPKLDAMKKSNPVLVEMEQRALLDNQTNKLKASTSEAFKLGYTQLSSTLTWQNISAEDDNGVRLYPLSGYIKPGQMLVFIGDGDYSGIKELFNILRDPFYYLNNTNLLSKSDKVCHGEILLNGLPPGKFYKRTISYIPKTDNHLAHLTVRETLHFSAKMRSPAHIEKEHIYEHIQTILDWLGINGCADTYVGDATLKGISGGQKRRLSIGVEVISGYSILIADLPTNGLDATTAYEVIASAKHVCEAGKSMIASLVQPSNKLFRLFDNCCIMSHGECIYFGPVSKVEEYLISIGMIYPNPKEKSLCGWIEELTKTPEKFLGNDLLLLLQSQQALSSRKIIRYLAQKFRQSQFFADLSQEVLWRHLDTLYKDDDDGNIPQQNDSNKHNSRASIINLQKPINTRNSFANLGDGYKEDDNETDNITEQKNEKEQSIGLESSNQSDQTLNNKALNNLINANYNQTYDLRGLEQGFLWALPKLPDNMYQIKTILYRQFKATLRNKPLIYSRIFQAISIGFCIGILFYQLDEEYATMRGRIGLLFFIIGFMGFGAVPFIPALAVQLPVFYYQKSAGYFATRNFYFAQILNEFPFTFVETLLFSAIGYPLVGLYPSAWCIILFFIVNFCVRYTSWAFCMGLTALLNNASVAQALATVFLPIGYAFNGYMLPTSSKNTTILAKIINKISFFTYPFQTLVNSQLHAFKNSPTKEYAEAWLDRFDIQGSDTWGDAIFTIGITIMWFIVFNCCAYYFLLKSDGPGTKKSEVTSIVLLRRLKRLLRKIYYWFLDLFCCGLGTSRIQQYKANKIARKVQRIRARDIEEMKKTYQVHQKQLMEKVAEEKRHSKIMSKMDSLRVDSVHDIELLNSAINETKNIKNTKDDDNNNNNNNDSNNNNNNNNNDNEKKDDKDDDVENDEDEILYHNDNNNDNNDNNNNNANTNTHDNDVKIDTQEKEQQTRSPNGAPLTYLEFSDLCYTVSTPKGEKQLLHNINGYVCPGDLIALMGASGAGKSTLLDVLAMKKNQGIITGNILLNGKPPDTFYSRNIGYIEQFDSHMASLTVQEAIEFSANLRLPQEMSSEKKRELIQWTMEQLDLIRIAHKTIGSVGTGISQENKKKVTIAVELVAQPGLLFLDEPTTGLDAASAYDVMKLVRDLANNYQTSIICTIHQPSREVFHLFDKILLLQEGGFTVYFGKLNKLNTFYEKHGFGKMEPDKNPADWAIEAVYNAPKPAKDIWLNTKEYQHIINRVKEGVCPKYITSPKYDSLYATSILYQVYHLTKREFKFFTRDINGMGARLIAPAIMGSMLGMLYFELDHIEDQYKPNVTASILYTSVVYSTESAAQEIPLLISERAMFYRETDSKFYSIVPYYVGRVIAEFPAIFIQSILYSCTIWPMAYNDWHTFQTNEEITQVFFKFWWGMLVILVVTTTFSQMLGVCSPNESVGNVLYTTLCTGSRMFGGFLIKLSSMNPLARFINGIDFFKYSLFYLAGTQIHNNETYHSYLKEELIPSENVDSPWQYFIGSVAFLIFFHIVIIIALLFQRWEKL